MHVEVKNHRRVVYLGSRWILSINRSLSDARNFMVQHVVVGACRLKFFSLGCQGLGRQMLHPCMGRLRRGAQPAPSISRREAQPTRIAVFLVVEPSKIMFLV